MLEKPNTIEPMFHPLESIFAESVLQMEEEYPNKVNAILQAFV
jgi:hypothetical protein